MLGFANVARRSGLGAVSRQARALAVTSRMQSTSYSTHSSSTMHENDPDVLEREKQRNLSGQQFGHSDPVKHAPGWNESLASSSEARIKADQDDSSPAELAAQTVSYVKKKYDPEERGAATNAEYPKEEVSGPLRDALGKAASLAAGTDADQVVVKEGTVILQKQRPNHVEIEAEENKRMTMSEEIVKADRGELI